MMHPVYVVPPKKFRVVWRLYALKQSIVRTPSFERIGPRAARCVLEIISDAMIRVCKGVTYNAHN